jgi:hypothetical protein
MSGFRKNLGDDKNRSASIERGNLKNFGDLQQYLLIKSL